MLSRSELANVPRWSWGTHILSRSELATFPASAEIRISPCCRDLSWLQDAVFPFFARLCSAMLCELQMQFLFPGGAVRTHVAVLPLFATLCNCRRSSCSPEAIFLSPRPPYLCVLGRLHNLQYVHRGMLFYCIPSSLHVLKQAACLRPGAVNSRKRFHLFPG